MKINHDGSRGNRRVGRVLGAAVCVLSMATGCGPAGREALEDILDSLSDGRGPGHGGPGGQGGSGNEPSPTCDPVDFDDLFELITDDLSSADADDATSLRYLTLANRHDAGLCSAAVREADRRALVKAVNMLSLSPTVTQPLQVDADGLLYRIDMRDYDWDRAIGVGGDNFADAWEAIAANNAYAVNFAGDDADAAVNATGTTFPVMLADSFVAAATSGDLYYSLIGVPEDIDAFILNDLGIDIEQNFIDQDLIRAGFSGDRLGLPDNAFLAERHEIEVRAGYFWQISDFGGGLDALIDDPLGQPQGESEIVFTLPNGLLGFALAGADGQRLNDSDLLLDPSQPNFAYNIAASAIAKFAQGVDVTDEVRRAALRSPDLSPEEKAIIREIYPQAPALAAIVDDDREQFYARALTAAGLDIDDAEPISPLLAAFAADVDLATAAGDVLLSPEAFQRDIRELPEAAQVLDGGGTLDRDDWTSLYVQSLCILSVARDNSPNVAVCDAAFTP